MRIYITEHRPITGFPASGKIIETWKMKKKTFSRPGKIMEFEKSKKPGKIMEFEKIMQFCQ